MEIRFQGFVLAVLDCKLNSRRGQGFFEYRGTKTRSPAASACGVIEKQQWLQGGFGYEGNTDLEIARLVFKVQKEIVVGDLAFRIDTDRLPPKNIRVFRGDAAEELSRREIQQLKAGIQWKSHRRLKAAVGGQSIPPSRQHSPVRERYPQEITLAASREAIAGLPPERSESQKEITASWLLRQAADEAGAIQDARGKAYAYVHIAKACADTGDKSLSRDCIKEARFCAEGTPDTNLKRELFVRIGETQALVGDIDGAMVTASELSMFPQAGTDSPSIGAKKRRGDGYLGDRAFVVAEIAVAQAKQGDTVGYQTSVGLLKAHAESVIDDDPDYSFIARTQARAGDIINALETAKALRSDNWEGPIALDEIIDARIRAGDFKGAVATVSSLNEVDECEKVCAYCRIGKAQAKAGDFKGRLKSVRLAIRNAPRSYSELRVTYFVDECLAFSSLAGLLAETGDLKRARHFIAVARFVADKRDDSFFKMRAYLRIAKAEALTGDTDAANSYIGLAKTIAYLCPFPLSFEQIAETQAQIGDIERAKTLAENIPHAGERGLAYREIASLYAKNPEVGRFGVLGQVVTYSI